MKSKVNHDKKKQEGNAKSLLTIPVLTLAIVFQPGHVTDHGLLGLDHVQQVGLLQRLPEQHGLRPAELDDGPLVGAHADLDPAPRHRLVVEGRLELADIPHGEVVRRRVGLEGSPAQGDSLGGGVGQAQPQEVPDRGLKQVKEQVQVPDRGLT